MRTTHPSPPASLCKSLKMGTCKMSGARSSPTTESSNGLVYTSIKHIIFPCVPPYGDLHTHKGNKEYTPATACLLACLLAP